jgi:hypothetical protein
VPLSRENYLAAAGLVEPLHWEQEAVMPSEFRRVPPARHMRAMNETTIIRSKIGRPAEPAITQKRSRRNRPKN